MGAPERDDGEAKSMIRMYGGRAEMVAIERVNIRAVEAINSLMGWLLIARQIRAISRQIKS